MAAVPSDLQRRERVQQVLDGLPSGSLSHDALALLTDRDRTALELVLAIYGEQAVEPRKNSLSGAVRWLRPQLEKVGLELDIVRINGVEHWRLRLVDVPAGAPLPSPAAVPAAAHRHAGRRVDVDLAAVIAQPEALARALVTAAVDLRPGQLLVYHCGPQNPPPALRKAAAEIARQLGFALRGWPEAPARVAGRNWSYAIECPAEAAKDFAGSRR